MNSIKARDGLAHRIMLGAAVVVAIIAMSGCRDNSDAKSAESRQREYDRALFIHDVSFIERLMQDGRFGARADALAEMEAYVNAPENVFIDKVTKERKVHRFFNPDGTLLTGEEILKLDNQDGGARQRNFNAWLVSGPVQEKLGLDLVNSHESFRQKWLQDHPRN